MDDRWVFFIFNFFVCFYLLFTFSLFVFYKPPITLTKHRTSFKPTSRPKDKETDVTDDHYHTRV